MAFGKRSKISDNLYDYSVLICGESGVGKSTVISETCEKEFGEDGYLLLNTGDEDGVAAIDGVTYEDVPTYKKYVEVCKDIVKNKKTEYPNLKVIVIDTLDQLIKVAENQAIDDWNKENMGSKNFKMAKSTNAIHGGFGASYDVVFNMIYDYIRALDKVGVKTWIICHSKTKEIIDPLTSASYTTLTSNMAQRYFNDFKTKVHVVGMACIDRTIETESTGRQNIVTHKDITVNKVKDEKRKIIFRDNSYAVDSKSRFSGIVDEIPLDSDELIKALKDAIKNSKKVSTSHSAPSPSPISKPIPTPSPEPDIDDELDDLDITSEEIVENPSVNIEDLRLEIRNVFKTTTDKPLKAAIKAKILEYGKLDDVDLEGLIELKEMID